MSGVIILAGGGDAAQSKMIDDYLKKLLVSKNSSRCLYIPIALPETHYAQAEEWFTSTYTYVEDLTALKSAEDASTVLKEDYDVIYMGGGNTGKLLTELHTYGLDVYIKEQLNKGAVVYGGSAGAIVLGKTIETAPPDEHSSNGRNQGLDLLSGFSVVPHFDGKFSPAHNEAAKRNQSGLLGISESTGVVFEGGRIVKVVHPEGLQKIESADL